MKHLNLIRFFTFLFFILMKQNACAQSGTWVWLHGDSIPNTKGHYGIKGVGSPLNNPPDSYESLYWTDKENNLWLFGGTAFGYDVNNLWKYNILNNEWTWMNGDSSNGAGNFGTKGIPSPLNFPAVSYFGANCWTDSIGDLWLYGGAFRDQLWRYHIPTNEWTWMGGDQFDATYPIFFHPPIYGPKGISGPNFTPGERAECKSGWVHQNKLYLFGGQMSNAFKNDLWSYDIGINEWAWESGNQDTNATGNYGTKGLASINNVPPSRFSYTRWQDSTNLFLFAGRLADSLLFISGFKNDVWKYDLLTKMWTWISGDSVDNADGTVNPFCDGNTNYIPMSRMENATCMANNRCQKTWWTFGGLDSNGSNFNDLWTFNVKSLKWTKVKGSSLSSFSQYYHFGTKGVADVANMPPSREGPAIWTDKAGQLYIYGGANFQAGPILGDLWKFIPDTSCFESEIVGASLSPLNDTSICPGDTLRMSIPLYTNIIVNPMANVIIDSIHHQIIFTTQSTTTYTVIAHSFIANDPCFVNDTVSFTISSFPPPIANFMISPQVTTLDQPTFNLINQSSNAIKYEWYEATHFISTAIDITITYTQLGEYCFKLIAENKCGVRDSITKCGKIIDKGDITIPNAFSPNQDGLNDFIKPIIRGNVQIKTFQIYNRWGENLFSAYKIDKGWDGKYKGKNCELGTYFYYLEASNNFGEQVVLKGDIMLIR